MRACRFRITLRSMEEGGRILHRNSLWTGCLPIDFGAPKTRQDVADLAVYDVTAIEFRGYLHRKRNLRQASSIMTVSGMARTKFPPRPRKSLSPPPEPPHQSPPRPCLCREAEKAKLPLDFIEGASSGFSVMPTVRCPARWSDRGREECLRRACRCSHAEGEDCRSSAHSECPASAA